LGNECEQIEGDVRTPFIDCLERVTVLLNDAQAESTVTESVDVAATARIIVGSVFGIEDMSARLTHGEDLLDRTDEWLTFIRPSLAGSPGTGSAGASAQRRRTELAAGSQHR
jgi:hypothetical protein